VAFSPDGKTVSSVCDCQELAIRLWDTATGRERALPDAHRRSILGLAFSPDGTLLASASSDQTVRLWHTANGKLLRPPLAHPDRVAEVAFAPNGRILASGAFDGRARLWDLATGQALRSLPIQGDTIKALAFRRDGQALAILTQSRTALCSVEHGAESGHWEGAAMLALAPDGRTQLVRYERTVAETEVQVLEFQHLLPTSKLGNGLQFRPPPQAGVQHAAYALDARRLATAGAGHVSIWDTATGRELHRFNVPPSAEQILMLSPDGKFVALVLDGRTIRLFEAATGQALGILSGHQDAITCLAFAPDGRSLVSGSKDSSVLLWDLSQGQCCPPRAGSRPTAQELEALWTDLGSNSAPQAQAALWRLVAVPEQAVLLLRAHLRSVPAFDPQHLAQYLADLDSPRFARRQQATKALEQLGERVELELRKVLDEHPSLEVRQRVENLLSKLTSLTLSPEQLQSLRALSVLERIGTPAARQVLQMLAAGPAGSRLTREAVGSLDRLKKLSKLPPL
jgi:WD40 repeat protein